jgi:thioredoxin-like negative regulator of GroEL
MRGGAKTKKQSKQSKQSRSTMGRMLPPVDITESKTMNELVKRITKGPLTLVFVYADWCGHCQSYKPLMSKLESMNGRTIQTARIRDDMFSQSPLSNQKIEGYPTLMLVDQNGEPVKFKTPEGEQTNAIPEARNMNQMSLIVRNAGKPEAVELLNKGAEPVEAVSVASKNNIENVSPIKTINILTATPATQELPNIPKNIVADRLPSSAVEQLNTKLNMSSSSALQEATAQKGGSLWAELASATIKLGPAIVLSSAVAYAGSKRAHKGARKTRKTRKTRSRK